MAAPDESPARCSRRSAGSTAGSAERRFRSRQPYRSRFPVICVGNFTAGGTGKTPLRIFIAELLIARGERPGVPDARLRRQHARAGWVDDGPSAAHTLFGDEPLLLATRRADASSRATARPASSCIETRGRDPSVVIMDDGLQNPALAKDLAIAARRRRARHRQRRGHPGRAVARADGIPVRPRRRHRRAGSAGTRPTSAACMRC